MAERYPNRGQERAPTNRENRWIEILKRRNEIMREQIEYFINSTIRKAHEIVDWFKEKGILIIKTKFQEKEPQAKKIYNKIEDLQAELDVLLVTCEDRTASAEEAEMIEQIIQQIGVEECKFQDTIPDIKSYLDGQALREVLKEDLPFED
ncbi:hypothetical protein LOD99_12968 [Oopsacas minuta]|uniref:Uncharacterized protein n=1 Tax=Oopsacas minuta TaxID=111878 RepID=A0AAV7IXG4_9METZ|nr:hypothetical protein LOD99_12968 [Oopsacas minuta]